jgi:hypothetical protein
MLSRAARHVSPLPLTPPPRLPTPGLGGRSIPGSLPSIDALGIMCSARYLIVIEKDAIFQVGSASGAEPWEEEGCHHSGSMSGSRTCKPSSPSLSLRPPLSSTPQALNHDRIFDSLPCVLVTAKGMPDLATRAFCSRLLQICPSLTVGLPSLPPPPPPQPSIHMREQ